MAPRADLQTLLVTLLGSSNVYFQPPPDFRMSYPCIVYHRSDINPEFADDIPYTLNVEYTVTVIDANPDSLIPMKVANLPTCIYDRGFRNDNLNHDVFKLFF